MESIEQTFNGTANFGQRVSATISRNGDLCHRMYLEVTLPDLQTSDGQIQGSGGIVNPSSIGYANAIGYALISSVEVEIGGQRIDKHYSTWMDCYDELTTPEDKQAIYRQEMIGKHATTNSSMTKSSSPQTIYIPLQFWFCRNPGLALPLIALQYHEVKVTIDFEDISKLIIGLEGNNNNNPKKVVLNTTKDIQDVKLWCDYIYLDTDERRRFAQVSHEYLIEQLQFTGAEAISSSSNKVRMNFNHPVKELVWVIQTDSDISDNRTFDYNIKIDSAKILLNGHDRITERTGNYFRLVQPYQHHTRIPGKNVYCYSFALKPEEHQPSGTCNFSRIDNAELSFTASGVDTNPSKIKIYAVNYNVLRIMSGMGGLAYSN